MAVSLLLALVTGCRKDNLIPPIDRTTTPRAMGAFIENNYDLSILTAALKKTGLLDTLNQGGPFTFFAPDNAAFNRMGITGPGDVAKMDVDSLRFMLRYHIIRNRYFTATFPRQMDNRYLTLSGEEIYVSVVRANTITPDDDMFVNGALIFKESKRNIALANGVLHILAKPLKLSQGTVQDYIAADTSLTLFAAAMKQFNLWDGLKTNKPLTVFAPANSAFLKYGLTAEKIASMNPADYKAITFAIYPVEMRPMHIFSTDGYLLSGTSTVGDGGIKAGEYSIAPGYSYSSYYNEETSFISVLKKKAGNWYPNEDGPSGANYLNGLANADHKCSNGIVHVIDDLFLNPDLMKQ
ncbi:fasciclin domain-containing protein [Chitinophaga ginsengisegetis]|uniref:fasciclin domain-containing protein n=1 Tax=Chitinophaga ginsengisegetis TaxID=393003 RepID=UPI000DC0290B|nr:fasciclin domain-containing protein [Chitinophaga ginsengisegetis]MDR6567462.1 putative surface protein with fasciclin (FAS1) repeats [Chitinophaga ginsengisegetis]MDR6647193.1 putative surface protein with fasciclin (FAS1) repeats [Chitinophaga ginsengisegetis]MDR6653542.1 putative surface protein with fasciclin (FAS1) repeats [Chitinophaga ginsengisegetis]